MTPAGIEPATFRFVAHHLNHCATAVPPGGITTVQLNSRSVVVTAEYVFNITVFLHTSRMYQHDNTRQHWNSKLPSQRTVIAQHD